MTTAAGATTIMAVTDTGKIALVIALALIILAAAFAFGVFFARLTAPSNNPRLEPPIVLGPVGFVHFPPSPSRLNSD